MPKSTIFEDYILPSKGLVYDTPFDPHIRIRSMTTAEEMRRLAYTDTPYKVMSDIIEDCLETPLPIKVYDLCLGDYQFLLHKLRIVTYGPEYKMSLKCPTCGKVTDSIANLDSLEVLTVDKDFREEMEITLPKSLSKVKLKLQTPRSLDEIQMKKQERQKKVKTNAIEFGLIYTILSLVDTVDGEKLNPITGESWVRNLQMKDANYILSEAEKFNKKIGLDDQIIIHCDSCGFDVVTTFRLTSEFFGPTNY